MGDEHERLIEEALRANLISPEQADEVRSIFKTVAEMGLKQTVAEILVKKGFIGEQQVRKIQREMAQRRIGKYEILDKLGEGGSGVVYRARHVTMGRIVALKVLSNKRASDKKYLERFVREARVAVTLNHRNIVRGLDYGESDGYHYFVMEFVPGDTLYEIILREGRLEEKRVLEIGAEVAKALRHALEFDLSHRDLKPDNILISVETREAKVCDLGLAKPKKLETAGSKTSSAAIGTPSYIAPEQIRGTDLADMRSDIYSLGATLYHAACGQPPFTGDSVDDLLRKHLNEEPMDPREIVVGLSSGAAAVLLKMLAKDPADRYQRLDDLVADLEAVRDGRPPVHTITFAKKAATTVEGQSRAALARQRSKPWKLVIPLLVVVAAVVGGILFMSGNGDGSKERLDAAPAKDDRPRGPTVTVPTEEDNARQALAKARGFWRGNPESWEAAAKLYRYVVDKYGETQSAIEARAGVQTVTRAWLTRARQSWQELEPDIDTSLEKGHYGAALAAIGTFPDVLRSAEGFEDPVEKRRKEINDAANAAWLAAEEVARNAIKEHRFAEALAAVDPLRRCGIKKIETDAGAAHETLTAERDRISALQRSGEDAYRTLYGRVLLTQGADGYNAAYRLLEEARSSKVFEFVGARLEEASRDLIRISKFADGIRSAYSGRRGNLVVIVTKDGRSHRGRLVNAGSDGLDIQKGSANDKVLWSDMPANILAEAGLGAQDTMKAECRLDAALWLMSKGRLDLVARQLEVAASLGEDVNPYKDRAELVRVLRDERVEEMLRRADAYLLDGRPAEACKELDRAVDEAPDHASARYRRGLILAKLHKDRPALEDLTEALRLGETEPRIHLEIARIHERAERFAEALAAYDAYLKTSPGGDDADEAVRRVGELRGRLNAGKAKELQSTADTAMRRRAWAEALKCYEEADRLVPDNDRVVVGIAKAAEKVGKIFQSYVTYRRYLTLRPTGSRAREARKSMLAMETAYVNPLKALENLGAGEQAYQVGKYDEAIDRLDQGLALAPLSKIAYSNRAYAWYSKSLISGVGSHTRSAIEDFDRVLLLEPGSPGALEGRALCWLQLGRCEKALDDARLAIQASPNEYLSYNTAGLACFAMERYGDSLAFYDRAIKCNPKLVVLYLNRARAKWLLRKLDAALADLDLASKQEATPDEVSEIREMIRKIERQKEGE
jgi:tetratricopeptide (TPR) repeat protein